MPGGLLAFVFVFVLVVWAVLGAASLIVCARGARRERALQRAVAWLQQSSSNSPEQSTAGTVRPAIPDSDERAAIAQSARITAALDSIAGRLPAGFLTARLADPSIPAFAGSVIASWLAGRSRDQLRAYAATRSARHIGRRVDALRVLARAQDEEAIRLLERAMEDRDPQIVSIAVNLLGSIPQRDAAIALMGALRTGRIQPSRIATALDRFPLPIGDLVTLLAAEPNPTARFWGATLLSRYGDAAGTEGEAARLARDSHAQVRKAAIETLGTIGGAEAATIAVALLGDPVWYVRAHAARALGDLGRADLARAVMPLLADRDWWVRQAAKESLQKMGGGVWRDLMTFLDHPDAFARNGAAEVLQNLGVLDSLIVLEATDAHPSAEKIATLRKIAAAGGVRMTNALLERADAALARRIRALLDTLGLEATGA